MKRNKYEKYLSRLLLTVAASVLLAACTRPLELGLGAPDSSSDGGDSDSDSDSDSDTESPDDGGQLDGSVPTDSGVTD